MIIVMSDSHGERDVIKAIKATYETSASVIIHCGDSELPASDDIWQGISVVKGNCDFDDDFSETAVLNADNQRFFVTHGHLFGVNWGLSDLVAAAHQKAAKIAFFGHLHTPIATVEDGVLCLNPGSVAQPRGQYNIKMYAKIDITQTHYKISYRDLQHQEIPNLQFELLRA
ncbi:metallophosphoesterase [Lactococcus insecticola]|uniref:Phosphoesterase n=1 Tax=Pseudolactococcus insecticola TaxID=2709158 RepID=A0A6A0B3U0_9LACT|nr:metallophosphoesterase [Lactococcus insecticola]GFH40009.1 phosphoesterase [Lactococcus insecticola]